MKTTLLYGRAAELAEPTTLHGFFVELFAKKGSIVSGQMSHLIRELGVMIP